MAESPDADTALVRRIARGERDALTELYARYRLPLFRYLLGLSPDWGLAEELLQDTLVAAWNGTAVAVTLLHRVVCGVLTAGLTVTGLLVLRRQVGAAWRGQAPREEATTPPSGEPMPISRSG